MAKKKEEVTSKIWEKIKKIYYGYGLDPDLMEEDEKERMIDYFEKNSSELEKISSKSSLPKTSFSDDELI
jgi:hypothetical protein